MKVLLFLVFVAARCHATSVQYTISGGSETRALFEDEKTVSDFELLNDFEDDSFRVISPDVDNTRAAHWLKMSGLNVTEMRVGRPFAHINPPDGYDTPEELLQQFRDLANARPDIASVFSLQTTYQTPPSHGGRHIYAIKISDNVDVDEDERNVMIASAHHCREIITPQIALHQASWLINNYGLDAAATALVDSQQTYFVWSMNPDGAHYIWTVDDMWRKNRRDNADGSFGIDLNRNYPIGWELPCSGSAVPSSNNYRGPFSTSEPEIQAMLAFQQDRHFERVIDFHSSGRDVRQIYGSCAALPQELDDFFGIIDIEIAIRMNYAPARSCCLGGNIHVAYHSQGALSFLSETGPSFQPPAEVMREELERVFPGWLYFMQLPTSIQGHVYDALTGLPVASTFVIPQLAFNLGELAAYTAEPYGRYHLWLPDGQWVFEITVDGKPLHTEVVDVVQGTTRDFFIV